MPSKKNIFIFAIIIITILLAGASGRYFKYYKKPKEATGKVLISKDRHLTPEQKQIYLDRVKKAENDLAANKSGSSNFNLRQINDHTYLAQQYFGLGELEKSKVEYLKVLKIDPKNEAALVGLAVTNSDGGELETAKILLESAIKYNPKNYNLWLELIDVRKSQNIANEEINKIYEQALVSTGRYIDIISKDAQFQESLGNINGAILFWQEALKVNPNRSEIYKQEINRLKRLQK